MIPGLKTPDGALYVTTQAPAATDVASGGVTMTADGWVHVNGNTPQRFDQGKGFMNNGDLCIDTIGSPVVGHVGGLPVTATGAIRTQLNQPVSPGDSYVGGLRIGPLGGLYIVDAAPVWTPANLFAGGEQGAWYDPSDLTTMFQDSAGTTPVTADGQPVGLILDKSKGLVLGSELVTQPYSIANANWSVSGTSYVKSLGSVTSGVPTNIPAPQAGKTYRITFTASDLSGATCYLTFGASSGFPAASGRIATAKTYSFILTPTTTSALAFVPYEGTDFAVTISNISVRELPGNHASQSTAASRPLYKTDGTYHWLQFDGVDDSLSTAAIDFTAVSAVTNFFGLYATKTSQGQLIELSPSYDSNPPAWVCFAPNGGTGVFFRGMNTGLGYNTLNSPSSLVNTLVVMDFKFNSAGTTVSNPVTGQGPSWRVNQVELITVDGSAQPVGAAFGSKALYIGSRAGTGVRYQGRIYSLIVLGRLATTQEITDTETWVNGKTGAY